MKEVASLKVKDTSRRQRKSLGKKQVEITSVLPIFTFIATMLLLVFSFAFNTVAPFGTDSILVSDLRAQYAPNLIRYKNHLREINMSNFLSSFSYEAAVGCGKNFMSTFGYYMSSPFNIISLFFPDHMINTVVVIITLLRLSFGSAFMCLFLQKRATDKKSCWPMAFGIMYAFSSFAVIFLFNILWFDGYMLLPLLLYFIECYIEKNKKIGIAVTLIFLFVSNFYASYMVGVFSFFYLLGRLIYMGAVEGKIKAKEVIVKTLKFVLLAVLCILAIGAFIIPVGLDVLNNRDVLVPSESTQLIQFRGIEILDQIFFGNVGDFMSLAGNLPYIFVSLTVTMLCTLFFITNVFEKKDKIFYGTILVLMYVSFNVTYIDLMWQAFDTPNWFCHRYSFVFIPVLMALALRVFEKIKEIPNKHINRTYIFLLFLLLITQSFGNLAKNGWFFILNVGLLSAYALVFRALKRTKWPEQLQNMQKISAFLLVLFMLFETAGMAPRTAEGLTAYANGLPDADYQKEAKQLNEVGQLASENNTGYRVAAEELVQKSEDIWIEYGYEMEAFAGGRAVGLFDSSCNRRYARFVKQLGFLVNFNYAYYSYSCATKPVDAFFSVGSIITTTDYKNAQLLSSDDKEMLFRSYKNSNALPVGFAVDKGAMDFQFYMLERLKGAKDYFTFQNNWYKSMFPENFTDDIYQGIYQVKDEDITVYNGTKMPSDKADIKIEGLFANDDPLGDESLERSVESKNTYYRLSPDAPIALTIKFTPEYSGEQYFCLASSVLQSENTTYIDGKEIAYVYPLSYFTSLLRLGYYEAGEEVELTITSSYEAFSYLDMYFATVNEENFDKQFDTIDLSKVTVDEYENGTAKFTTNLGENELLLTTIPYEKGWKCYVDGEKTDITVYQDALIAVDPGPGTHEVELKFVAPGIRGGIVISAVGIVLLIVFIALDRNTKTAVKAVEGNNETAEKTTEDSSEKANEKTAEKVTEEAQDISEKTDAGEAEKAASVADENA